MKKLLALSVIVLLFSAHLSAQKSEFKKGSQVLNLGIGFGSTVSWGNSNSVVIPPLSASYEVGVVDKIIEKGVIGVGGYLGVLSYRNEITKYSNLIIGARGSFHYPLVDKLDLYTGLMLGYNFYSFEETGVPYGASSGFIGSWYIGGRYFFTDKFAAMAEVGYGVTFLNLGIALKFK